ncbi:hypothetical protein [Magnetofaba australis]|uniref:Uncharacterized protein n=1 Tax=Magnetofaba australis IT-1 TaxID=1434232 RepID=A0A1Y2K1C8_9PROT|nr:hypothetical protein [Magnetofaba australis]OSM01813.1 hypothetical protein MAIT1_01852 [Magnetofaba australis IT-1]
MESLDRPGSDAIRADDLPDVSLTNAAFLAGVAPEALRRLLAIAAVKPQDNEINLGELIRAAFLALTTKETQTAMLRLQLHAALEREKSLVEALQQQIGDNFILKLDLDGSDATDPIHAGASSDDEETAFEIDFDDDDDDEDAEDAVGDDVDGADDDDDEDDEDDFNVRYVEKALDEAPEIDDDDDDDTFAVNQDKKKKKKKKKKGRKTDFRW